MKYPNNSLFQRGASLRKFGICPKRGAGLEVAGYASNIRLTEKGGVSSSRLVKNRGWDWHASLLLQTYLKSKFNAGSQNKPV